MPLSAKNSFSKIWIPDISKKYNPISVIIRIQPLQPEILGFEIRFNPIPYCPPRISDCVPTYDVQCHDNWSTGVPGPASQVPVSGESLVTEESEATPGGSEAAGGAT
jgi:hypothetical protein